MAELVRRLSPTVGFTEAMLTLQEGGEPPAGNDDWARMRDIRNELGSAFAMQAVIQWASGYLPDLGQMTLHPEVVIDALPTETGIVVKTANGWFDVPLERDALFRVVELGNWGAAQIGSTVIILHGAERTVQSALEFRAGGMPVEVMTVVLPRLYSAGLTDVEIGGYIEMPDGLWLDGHHLHVGFGHTEDVVEIAQGTKVSIMEEQGVRWMCCQTVDNNLFVIKVPPEE